MLSKKLPTITFERDYNQVEGFELVHTQKLFDRLVEHSSHIDPFAAHRIDFFAIFLSESKPIKHTIDFNEYELNSGDCLVISKYQVHSFHESPQFTGQLLMFTEEFLKNHTTPTAMAKLTRLYNYHWHTPHYHDDEGISQLLDALNVEINVEEQYAKAEIIAAVLTTFLLRLERLSLKRKGEGKFNPKYTLFDEFRRRVEEGYATSRDASFYASELNISYKHLNEVSKEFTSKTAKEFIDDFILLEAKRKLVTTSLSGKEVGYDCGFNEPTNFTKYFKKRTGITPIEFRSNHVIG